MVLNNPDLKNNNADIWDAPGVSVPIKKIKNGRKLHPFK